MSFSIQYEYHIEHQTGVKGQLTIDVCPEYRDIVRAFLKQHVQTEKEKGCKIRKGLIMNPNLSKRSLDANACMHHWYGIEAKCLNAGMGGSGAHEITAWQRYEDDLKEFCPKEEIIIKPEFFGMYKNKFRHTHIIEKNGDQMKIQIWKTSSHFTITEMAYWINRIINRIGSYGVPLSMDEQGHVKSEWIKMQKWLAKNKIILHSEKPCTKEEYKHKVPICEASGTWLGQDGEVAHISAVGMGGKEEPEKDHPSNWFHLRGDIHQGLIHGKGWDSFLNQYPWLKYKWKIANLSKNAPETHEDSQQGVLFDESKVDKEENIKCKECGSIIINGQCGNC